MKNNKITAARRFSSCKVIVMFVLLVAGMLAWNVSAPTGRALAAATTPAACTPTGTTYGTDTLSLSIPAGGGGLSYTVWSRIQVPATPSGAPLILNIDSATGTNCYSVGNSSVAANTWVWVNSGTITLSQAAHSFVYTGLQSGVSLDRTEVLSDSTCTPTGTGDNCTPAADTTPPTVSVTAPANGATVSGTTTLSATASDDSGTVSKVEFYNGSTLLATDTTAPYTYSWNTTTVANGSHTITAKAYDLSNNVGTSSAVTVTVSNAAACTTGTLAAPTGLTKGTVTYTSIGLTWTAPSPTPGCSLTGYKVFRDGTQVGTPTTTSFTDTGLTAGDSNTYTVEAVDSGPNTSVPSAGATITSTADNLAPNAPSNLAATPASAGKVNLAWTDNGDLPSPGGVGVAGYNVYRCTGASCTPNTTATPVNGSTLVSGTSYSDTTVSASTSYNYIVTAVDNNNNESAPSNTDNALTPAPTCTSNPSQPGTPTAGTRTISSVSFSWTAPTTIGAGCTLSGYHIYQVNGSNFTLITSTSVPTVTITALAPNTSFIYAVQAYDSSGHTSTQSTAPQITIATLADTTAPTLPGSVTATAASASQVNLSWSASTDNVGVTGYKIYRCNSASCTSFNLLTTISGTTTLSYNDTSVAASTSYTYEVSAVDAAGNESAKGASDPVTTPAATGTAPSAPRSPAAPVVATQSAGLTWTAPATGTVTGYHVYINGVLDTVDNGGSFSSNSGTLSCLAPSVDYTVTIKAFNGAGEGPAATVPVSTPSGGLSGDLNCSSSVDATDFFTLLRNWQSAVALPVNGDVNGDINVNSTDFFTLLRNYGKSS